MGAGEVVTELSYIEYHEFTADSSTPSTTMNFGVADGNRYIVVCISIWDNANPTAVTVGGVSATEVVAARDDNARAEVWIAAVPTGTSGTVALTLSKSTDACVVSLYRLIHRDGTALDSGTSIVDNPSVTLNVSNGGAVAAYMSGGGSAVTWSGATEHFDIDIDTGEYASHASNDAPGTGTLNIQVTQSATFEALAAASWD